MRKNSSFLEFISNILSIILYYDFHQGISSVLIYCDWQTITFNEFINALLIDDF